MADSTVVCWNCNEVVAADRSECPRCMAGLEPAGRGLTDEQFRSEQAVLKTRLGIPGGDKQRATAFEKVFVGVVVLFLTVGGGLLLGGLLARVISRCESWDCIPAMGIGAVLGAVIGLVLGVNILIYKYSNLGIPDTVASRSDLDVPGVDQSSVKRRPAKTRPWMEGWEFVVIVVVAAAVIGLAIGGIHTTRNAIQKRDWIHAKGRITNTIGGYGGPFHGSSVRTFVVYERLDGIEVLTSFGRSIEGVGVEDDMVDIWYDPNVPPEYLEQVDSGEGISGLPASWTGVEIGLRGSERWNVVNRAEFWHAGLAFIAAGIALYLGYRFIRATTLGQKNPDGSELNGTNHPRFRS